ncbi:MAG TPA: cytochrome P450 [Solirubrobacteraceae bacterium]|nr:cytochrome P450 [Solirubrobacteraceae bacterium]
MTDVTATPVDQIDLGDMELWDDGFPHEIFERLRKEDPVHWSPMATWEGEPGFWSITRADDIHEVSRRWEDFSSQVGGIVVTDHGTPLELQTQMFIAMDPPRHDRIKALFQRGFTPKRIAEHEQRIGEIVERVLDRLEGRDEIDLVAEIATPVVSRVIGSFVGTEEKDDAAWSEFAQRAMAFGDEELQPGGIETVMQQVHKAFEDGGKLVAERRQQPTDDLTSVLVTAEVDGEGLSDEEIIMGFALLQLAGNDSTKATFSNGMLALLERREQWRKLVDDPSRCEAAVEEMLRWAPAFAHFRRTATCDVEFRGKQIRKGDKVVMWYPSSNRDERVYECPHQFDVERNPEHQAFGAGGRHFCLGTALARMEMKLLLEGCVTRFPDMELISEPRPIRSLFLNQQRELWVRLGAPAAT